MDREELIESIEENIGIVGNIGEAVLQNFYDLSVADKYDEADFYYIDEEDIWDMLTDEDLVFILNSLTEE